MEEKDNATCLTLSRCAAQFNNILEDIYIEARMCEEYPGTFKQEYRSIICGCLIDSFYTGTN